MKCMMLACLAASLCQLMAAQPGHPAPVYDLLIQGGTIYDGGCGEPYVADIAIKGDRIAKIGRLEGRAAKVVSAKGYVVTPGFIDIHDHSDENLETIDTSKPEDDATKEKRGHYSALLQGVTTVVTGNCSTGMTDTAKFFTMLDTYKSGTNMLHLASHGRIREELFKSLSIKLTPEQMETFKARLGQEMKAGACGMSTGLAMTPAIEKEEIIELAKVVGKYGGMYATHMRDESGWPNESGKTSVLAAIEEAIEIGKKAKIPVQISHLKLGVPFTIKPADILGLIEKAREDGLDVTADSYPYTAGQGPLAVFLPPKYKSPEGGIADKYKTPEGRIELKVVIQKVLSDVAPEKFIANKVTDAEGKEIVEYRDKDIKVIAGLMGLDPVDCFIKLACDYKVMAILGVLSEDAMKEFMTKPFVFTCADGMTWAKAEPGAHPRYYGAFTRKLKHFALDTGWITFNHAVRSMTLLPAKKLGLKDRGRIKAGAYADLAVLDLATLADKSTYEKPTEYATGAVHVLVNGVFAVEDRQITGQRAGRPLKGKGACAELGLGTK